MNNPKTLIPTGDDYLDELRKDIQLHPTDRSNFRERTIALKLWATTLQQVGIELNTYLPVDQRLASHQFHTYEYTTDPDQELLATIDRGFTILEALVQRRGFSLPKGSQGRRKKKTAVRPISTEREWPLYQKDLHHTGFSPFSGPTQGTAAWKYPINLGWQARPVIEDEYIYVTSPGIRVSMHKLHKRNGNLIWKCRREIGVVDDQLYHAPCAASTPVIAGNEIVFREAGSRGNNGWARYLVMIDKFTGRENRKITACHVDYRAGYAPFAAHGNKAVYASGVQDIEGTPVKASPLDEIVCKDLATGDLLWSFFTGPIFSEPVIYNNSVFVGTLHGDSYCLRLDGEGTRSQRDRIRWHKKNNSSLNTTPILDGRNVIFCTNNGEVLALDQESGEEIWVWSAGHSDPRAFRRFSRPTIKSGRIYISSSDGYLYCIDSTSGRLLWDQQTDKWLRAAPVIVGRTVFVAATDGTVIAFLHEGDSVKRLWQTKIGEHAFLADPVESEGLIYLVSANLYLFCMDPAGDIVWKQSLIESVSLGNVRILTDQLAGGSYYTGKPTASGELAYVGSPSGFVHAIDLQTGTERWRFECGGAVSSALSCYKQRVYFGQQGGEDWYYCLDADNGSLVWKQSIGWVWGSANLTRDRVLIPGIDGFLNCLDAVTGAILWRHRTSRSACSEPAIDGDLVFFGGWDHYLYALNLFTGNLAWKFHVDGACDSGAPIARDGLVYLPSGGSDRFRCLNAITGRVVWEFIRPKTNFNATPAFDGENIYISINQGTGLCGLWVTSTICCLNARTGELKWEHEGGGLPAPVVGAEQVFFGSSESPYFFCVDKKPDAHGKAVMRWKYYLGGRMWETAPALVVGKALVLSDNGYLIALE